ncbi:hypothetical protein D7030_01415 [Flavobacteriaceae bacterium AU392]|nr:hypothetical protein D1817_07870 [Flavobacteriaceae bacterium]RKM86538.1 hypothetical protein D7030_01415 [Flavobacteriaceae bacterium AU392]
MTDKAAILDDRETYFALFGGNRADLSKLDFSILNLKFIERESEEFEQYIAGIEDNSEILKNAIKEYDNSKYKKIDKNYALVPIDSTKDVTELDLFKVRNILLLINPSNITLQCLFGIRRYEKTLEFFMYDRYYVREMTFGKPFKDYFYYYDSSIDDINRLITIFTERYEHISYLIPAFNSYISSFLMNFKDMEYLSLCISLETVVEATTELNYRIKRNIAVLLSEEDTFGERIFKNVGLIYGLRSKIAHSGKFKESKINEYLPYLRSLASMTIIELLKLNIQNLTDLNNLLTKIGYGDSYNKSKEFEDFEASVKDATMVFATELTK